MSAQLDTSQEDEFVLAGLPAANLAVAQSDQLVLQGPVGAALTVVQEDEFIMVGPRVLNPGQVIQVGCSLVVVTGGTGDSYTGTIIGTFSGALIPGTDTPVPVAPGEWSVYDPTTTITGLDQLDGQTVMALADGLVQGPFTVEAGAITLPTAASVVCVGLSYVSQYKDLYLTTPSAVTEGKMKEVTGVTVRFDCSLGVTVGPGGDPYDPTNAPDFSSQAPVPDLYPTSPYSSVPTLVSKDCRLVITPQWATTGVVCVEQSAPLPCTILGIYKEVLFGDTRR